jgi:hypothetical protein
LEIWFALPASDQLSPNETIPENVCATMEETPSKERMQADSIPRDFLIEAWISMDLIA